MPTAPRRDDATFDPAWIEWNRLTQQRMDESMFTEKGHLRASPPVNASADLKALTLVEIEQELHRASEEYLAVCELADAADRKVKDAKQRVLEWQRAFDLFFSEMRNSAPPGTQWNPANSSFCRQASANSAGGAAE